MIGEPEDIETTSEELLEGIYGVEGVHPVETTHDLDDMGSPEVLEITIYTLS